MLLITLLIACVRNLEDWESLGDVCVGSPADAPDKTFSAQSNFVMAVPGQPGAFIFMADRWNKDNLPQSR